MAHIGKIPDLNKGDLLHKKAKHATAPDMRLSGGALMASMTKDPIINCMIYRRSTGEYYAKLQLRSHVKPDRLLESSVEFSGRSEQEIGFQIGVVCGAMAERLGESYGDNFDVEKTARQGESQFQNVIRAWERSKLAPQEREAPVGN